MSFVKWDLGQTARANTKGSISCTTTDLSICEHVYRVGSIYLILETVHEKLNM